MTLLAWIPTLLVAGLTVHTALNARLLRRPASTPPTVDDPVAVLLPVRDEANRVAAAVAALRAQRGVPRLEILVLDDGSTDGTADVVRAAAAGDPRVTVLSGAPLPAGWLGKPHACQQLADRTNAEFLVFIDADVALAPRAVAAAVGLLDRRDLVSPYPRVQATGAAERLVQPLLQWSWLTFLPLRAMERSARPSLTAVGGQFLAVRRRSYVEAGGHAAVRAAVLEDIELARAVKRAGGRVALADGSALATCRMYGGWRPLVDGYTKSLWAAFGSAGGALAVALALVLLYVAPPAVALTGAVLGSTSLALAGLTGYGLGVLGRVVAGASSGARVWPDALAHPVSVAAFVALLAWSFRRRRTVRWKGRPVVPS